MIARRLAELHSAGRFPEESRCHERRRQAARAQFVWDDPLLLDEVLTEDERMIRDSAGSSAWRSCCRACRKPSARRTSTARS